MKIIVPDNGVIYAIGLEVCFSVLLILEFLRCVFPSSWFIRQQQNELNQFCDRNAPKNPFQNTTNQSQDFWEFYKFVYLPVQSGACTLFSWTSLIFLLGKISICSVLIPIWLTYFSWYFPCSQWTFITSCCSCTLYLHEICFICNLKFYL